MGARRRKETAVNTISGTQPRTPVSADEERTRALARTVDEWRLNVELHKFHDDLKQKRFTHLITLQTAAIALLGLLLTAAVREASPLLLLTAGLFGLFARSLLHSFQFMDQRARAYVDVVKGKILLLEERSRTLGADPPLSTYTDQFRLLSHRDEKTLKEYERVRGFKKDTLRELVFAPAAHANESMMIARFMRLWELIAVLCLLASGIWAIQNSLNYYSIDSLGMLLC